MIDEIGHRVEALVRVIYQYILLFQYLEKIVILIEFPRIHGIYLREAQPGIPFDRAREPAEKTEIKGTFDLEDRVGNFKFFFEHLERVRVDAPLYFQADRRSPTPLTQFFLYLLQQILGTFFVESQVGVARQPELIDGKRRISAEQRLYIMTDQFLNQDKRLFLAVGMMRQRDDPG
ncbi:hypothetical protein D3C74_284080 [compost metagenome]